MLERLEQKIESVFRRLQGLHKINDKNIEEGIREIRLALLEADVHYKVVKDFIENIKNKSIGEKVYQKVSPVEQFYKIVYDELVEFMGGINPQLNFKAGEINIIMLIGLQGSGKTTTAAKLAYFLKDKSNSLLVGADVYRPAAKDQLRILAEKENFGFYSEDHMDSIKICENAVKYAKKNLFNTIILDTAGRLHLDETLMEELVKLKKAIKPQEILFVADSMVGQSIVNIAQQFNEKLDFSGIVLSKFDSDAKGGVTLSLKKTIGKMVKFIGVGEKIKDLELFHPDRIASRILGRGDILTLVEKTQKVIELDDAEKLTQKMLSGNIDLSDFLMQIKMMKKIGNISSLMELMPLPSNVKNMDMGAAEKEFKKIESMILSMTMKERKNFRIIESSRKRRISKGSGTTLKDITVFIDNFQKMGKMIKKFTKNTKLIEKILQTQNIKL